MKCVLEIICHNSNHIFLDKKIEKRFLLPIYTQFIPVKIMSYQPYFMIQNGLILMFGKVTQQEITCSKLTLERLEQSVKYVSETPERGQTAFKNLKGYGLLKQA